MAVKKDSPEKKEKASEKKLQITLIRSLVGHPRKHREVVKGLGLRKVNSKVICKDCPEVRGMIGKVPYLLEVKELKEK